MKTFNQDKIRQIKKSRNIVYRYEPFPRFELEQDTPIVQITKSYHCYPNIFSILKILARCSFLIKVMLERGMYKKDIKKRFNDFDESEKFFDNIIKENIKEFVKYSKNTIGKFAKNIDDTVFKYRVSDEEYKPMTEEDILDTELRDSSYKKEYFINKEKHLLNQI